MSKIKIVIVTYNGMLWLPRCLNSIKSNSVILVDNNSTDGTVDYVLNNFPEINIIEQKKNIGFGQANNIGISKALNSNEDYVFLLNQDAYLKDDCLDKLVQVHKENKGYGILSPIHLNGNGNRLDEKFSQYVNYIGNRDFYSDFVLNKIKKIVYQVPFVNAAGWLISKECIEKVGGFDPIFFHYGEDDNYCQRLKYHGFKIGVVPEAILLHDRENRSRPISVYGDVLFFKNLESQLKRVFADINKSWKFEINNLIIKRKNSWLKASLKLDFKNASIFYQEYLMLKKIKSEIEISRQINKTPYPNYLNLDK